MKKLLAVAVFAMATLIPLAAQEQAEHKESPEEQNQVWKWANFGILAIGLGYLIGKSMPAVFKSRTEEIQTGISEAQKVKQDAERRSAEMDARLASLGADIEKFRTQSAVEMEQEGDRIRKETAAQMKKIEEQAAVEIETAGKTARRQLKEYAGQLALGLAEERLRSRMDSATEASLVDNFARELERQNSRAKN